MRPPRIGNVVVLMPNGFTMLNLCLGMLAIISAFAGDFKWAGTCVVLGGVCDAMDGRIARATHTGTRFGEELDSLTDIVSFGVAPAMIMYAVFLKDERMSWLWPFIFIAAAAIRLAKFNVEQAGQKKTYFYGLPSPAAGMTLATYHSFSQTTLYTESWVASLPWQQTMRGLMVVLAVLMMSNVQYPAVPTVGFKSIRSILGTLIVAGTLIGVTFFTWQFFFPALLAYVAYGLVKTAIVGLADMRLHALENGAQESADLSSQDNISTGGRIHLPGRGRRRRRRGGGRRGRGGPSGGGGGGLGSGGDTSGGGPGSPPAADPQTGS